MRKFSYFGIRENGAAQVFCYRWSDPAQGTPLDLRLDLRRHSLPGFEWGYPGSGPAQLACHFTDYPQGDVEALVLYQQFKTEFITKLPRASWALAERDINVAFMTIRQAARHV